MKDMLTIIYEALLKDAVIAEKVTNERIAYYEYPEEKTDTEPFIIIIPLHPHYGGTSGSNQELSTVHTVQIDVQGSNRKEVKLIQRSIKHVMWRLHFAQLPEGLDDYLREVKRFVDARRYRTETKLYDTNY